jgi:uncharacterized protein involved in type VI secretion and phage assembly
MPHQYAGVVTGIVKELDMELARIKVEFPWLQESYRSGWAPVAMPLSGKERGMFFMPEIDDEVLVAFEQGNFEHPFIVGFLWNGVDKPPENTNQNRVILTPGGHTLRFEDADNQKKVILKSDGGHTISLDDTSQGQVVTLRTKLGLLITMDDKDGSIELQGGGRHLALRNGVVQIS